MLALRLFLSPELNFSVFDAPDAALEPGQQGAASGRAKGRLGREEEAASALGDGLDSYLERISRFRR